MAIKKKTRKTRITKEDIEKVRKPKEKANKRKTDPGPWTNINPTCIVDIGLRGSNLALGSVCYGTYPKHGPTRKKGWYNIIFNVTSKDIKECVEKHGLDNYIAACEKWFARPENKKKYGTVIILKITIDNSTRDNGDRFISCMAKTNKKSINGFAAIRQGLYQIIGANDELL